MPMVGWAGPVPVPPTNLQMPGISLQVSFTAPFDTPNWVDISDYMISAQTQLGRQHELNQIEAATGTVVLSNRDNRFTPWNTDSPYASLGNGIVPSTSIRMLAIWDNVVYGVFYGYVTAWQPSFPEVNQAICTVTFTDNLGLLNLAGTSQMWRSRILADGATHFWPLQDTTTTYDYAVIPPVSNLTPNAVVGYGKLETFATAGSNYPPDVFGLMPVVVDGGTATIFEYRVSSPATSLYGYYTTPWSVTQNADGSSQFTLEFWQFWESGGNYPTDEGLSIRVSDAGDTYGFMAGLGTLETFSGGTTTATINAQQVLMGTWHYCAIVAQQTPLPHANTIYYYYVDRALVGKIEGDYPYPTSGTLNIGNNGAGVSLPNYCAMCEVAYYPTQLTPSNLNYHYYMGVALSGLSTSYAGPWTGYLMMLSGIGTWQMNLTPGAVPLNAQTYSDMSGSQMLSIMNNVTGSERGLLYQNGGGGATFIDSTYISDQSVVVATYSDDPTFVGPRYTTQFAPTLDDLDLWNDFTIASTTQQVTNSINSYGRRTYQSNLQSIAQDGGASLVPILASYYAHPQVRIAQIELSSTTDQGTYNFPEMLSRHLMDKVHIHYGGVNGGTALDIDSWIEGISHKITKDTWVTTFALSPLQIG